MRHLRNLSGVFAAMMVLGAFLSASAWASGPPVNTAKPTMLGTAEVGKSEHITNGTWTESPTSYTYQWQRCDESGSGCTNISGATAQVYPLVEADVGHTVDAQVTAHNAFGQGTATSAPSAVVKPAPKGLEIIPNPSESNQLVFISTGRARFEVPRSTVTECTVYMTGRFVDPVHAKKISIEYRECSPGIHSYTTATLEGTLGYLNKSAKTVGLKLRPENPETNLWIPHFYNAYDSLQGMVFGSIGTVNTPFTTTALSYAEVGEHQQYLGFEGANEGQLLLGGCGSGTCPMNLVSSQSLSFASKIEIHAP
jgi:hypothetical protein